MAFAIDIINKCGPSNEMHCQLYPKKTKIMLGQQKAFYPTNKMVCISFKIGLNYAIEAAIVICINCKCIK